MKFSYVFLAIALFQFNNCGASTVGVVTFNDNVAIESADNLLTVMNDAKVLTNFADFLNLFEAMFASESVQKLANTIELKDLVKFAFQIASTAKKTDLVKQLHASFDNDMKNPAFKNALIDFVKKVYNYLTTINKTMVNTKNNSVGNIYVWNPVTHDTLNISIPKPILDVAINTVDTIVSYLSKY